MEKEILKRNIEQVINQPCLSKYPNEIKPNGLSEDGTYIMVQVEPKDSSRQIDLIDGYVDRILASLPEQYRDKLVTLRHDNWVSYSYVPVFDTDTQAMWDKEYHDYCAKKQAWCDKYGSD